MPASVDPPAELEVWGYETWTPLPANRIVDITSVLDRKKAAIAAHRFSTRQAKDRTQPLAARGDAVAHRVGNGGRARGRRGKEREQRSVDFGAA